MKDKYDFMQGFTVDSRFEIAKTLAAFGAQKTDAPAATSTRRWRRDFIADPRPYHHVALSREPQSPLGA